MCLRTSALTQPFLLAAAPARATYLTPKADLAPNLRHRPTHPPISDIAPNLALAQFGTEVAADAAFTVEQQFTVKAMEAPGAPASWMGRRAMLCARTTGFGIGCKMWSLTFSLWSPEAGVTQEDGNAPGILTPHALTQVEASPSRSKLGCPFLEAPYSKNDTVSSRPMRHALTQVVADVTTTSPGPRMHENKALTVFDYFNVRAEKARGGGQQQRARGGKRAGWVGSSSALVWGSARGWGGSAPRERERGGTPAHFTPSPPLVIPLRPHHLAPPGACHDLRGPCATPSRSTLARPRLLAGR